MKLKKKEDSCYRAEIISDWAHTHFGPCEKVARTGKRFGPDAPARRRRRGRRPAATVHRASRRIGRCDAGRGLGQSGSRRLLQATPAWQLPRTVAPAEAVPPRNKGCRRRAPEKATVRTLRRAR